MTRQISIFLKHLFGTTHAWQFTLLNNWKTIIGKLHTKVIIEKIYNDTIILGVIDSCWLQELYLLSPVLLNRINKTLDQPYIKKIRFKKQSTLKKKRDKKRYHAVIKEHCYLPSPKEEQVLQAINNVELRTVLKDFLVRCYRERESEEGHHRSNSTYSCK